MEKCGLTDGRVLLCTQPKETANFYSDNKSIYTVKRFRCELVARKEHLRRGATFLVVTLAKRIFRDNNEVYLYL